MIDLRFVMRTIFDQRVLILMKFAAKIGKVTPRLSNKAGRMGRARTVSIRSVCVGATLG